MQTPVWKLGAPNWSMVALLRSVLEFHETKVESRVCQKCQTPLPTYHIAYVPGPNLAENICDNHTDPVFRRTALDGDAPGP